MANKTKSLIYQQEYCDTKLDIRLTSETVWITQKGIAELYQTSTQNITFHIKNIYEEAELQEESTCKYYLQVQNEGSREVKSKTLQPLNDFSSTLPSGYTIPSVGDRAFE